MALQDEILELWEDYLALEEKFSDRMPNYEFCYALIGFASKKLMDYAPRHALAIETIREASEAGIRWHVEEKNKEVNHGID